MIGCDERLGKEDQDARTNRVPPDLTLTLKTWTEHARPFHACHVFRILVFIDPQCLIGRGADTNLMVSIRHQIFEVVVFVSGA